MKWQVSNFLINLNTKSVIKKSLRILGWVSLVLIIILIASCSTVSIIGKYMDIQAENKATDFCHSIKIGSDIQTLIKNADEVKIFHYEDGNITIFQFPSFLLSSFECAVAINGNTISNARVQKDTW